MKLLPEEKALRFEGFSSPVAAYRTSGGRLAASLILAAVLAAVATAAGAGGVLMLQDPNQINKPLLAVLMGAVVLLMYGWALYLVVRVLGGWGRRVLLYPEGIVVWKGGGPRPYRWEQIESVDCRRMTLVGPNAGLGYLFLAGKELEYTFVVRDGEPIVLSGLLDGLHELGPRVEQKVKRRGAPPRPEEKPPWNLPKFPG
jgi:hypothetical protein